MQAVDAPHYGGSAGEPGAPVTQEGHARPGDLGAQPPADDDDSKTAKPKVSRGLNNCLFQNYSLVRDGSRPGPATVDTLKTYTDEDVAVLAELSSRTGLTIAGASGWVHAVSAEVRLLCPAHALAEAPRQRARATLSVTVPASRRVLVRWRV